MKICAAENKMVRMYPKVKIFAKKIFHKLWSPLPSKCNDCNT